MSDEPKQWWQTLPAIIAGSATLLTALTGLLVALNQLGVFKQAENKPTPSPEAVGATPYARTGVTPAESATASPQVAAETRGAIVAPTSTPTSSKSEFTGGYDPAMAFVDMQRIFKEHPKTKIAEVKINDAKNAASKEYDERAEAYKEALDEINNLNRQLNDRWLSAEAKSEKANERDDKIANIKKMEKEINELAQTRKRQLDEQTLRMRREIVNEITDKIRALGGDVANIIFDRSGLSLNGVPVLMYSPNRAEMSGNVIQALNDRSHSTFTTTHNLKIAAIDMQRAFKEDNRTKDAERKINDARNAAKKEYDNRTEAYKKELDEINNLNRQLNDRWLSAEAKSEKANERDDKIANIKKMEGEIKEFSQTRDRQLQEQLMRMREGIVKEITDVMMDAVKTNNIGVVLDISAMSINGVPVVIYRHGIPDFTDEAVAKLNGTHSSSNMLAPSDSSRTLRFGVMDMHRTFEAWPEMKAAEAKINDAKNAAKKEYDDRADSYKKALDEINNLNRQLNDPALSAEAKSEKANERDDKIAKIKKMEGEINEFRQTRDKEIGEEAKKLKDSIVAKIAATVSTCAGAAGFNLVFDSSGNTVNGVPVVVFARDLPDLTDAVLKEHGRSH